MLIKQTLVEFNASPEMFTSWALFQDLCPLPRPGLSSFHRTRLPHHSTPDAISLFSVIYPVTPSGMLVHTQLWSHSRLVDINDQVCYGTFPIAAVGFSRISGEGYDAALSPPGSHNVLFLRIQLAPPHIGCQFVARSWQHVFVKRVFGQGLHKYLKNSKVYSPIKTFTCHFVNRPLIY